MNLIHEFCKISCNEEFTHSCGCSSSTYLFLLLLFYPARCSKLYQQMLITKTIFSFKQFNTLLPYPRSPNGNSSSLLGQFKIYQTECMLSISVFLIFFFFSEQLLVFHQFCFLFWVYPGCSEYLLSMTTPLCFSISLQYPTQYRYGIRRNQLIERICIAAQVDELYRVQKFDYYQLN